MRIYAAADEERIRLQARVKDWTASRLLNQAQGAALGTELRTDLRRTNAMLRAVLAFFTVIIATASIGLVSTVFRIRAEGEAAVMFAVAAFAYWMLAERLVRVARVYRYGVEEALAAVSVAAMAISVALGLSASDTFGWRATTVAGLLVGAAGATAAFLRFGFVYAGVIAMACMGTASVMLDLRPELQRALAASVLTGIFLLTRFLHRTHGDDHPGDDYAALEAAAWAGVYLAVNLRIADVFGPWGRVGELARPFYWATYGLTWLLPAAGLAMGIRAKSRTFIDVNLVLGLFTLATNKPYFGWPRAAWDPMILGTVLMLTALGVRRWMARGPGGERGGFTAERLLESDRALIGRLGTMSAALPAPAAPAPVDRPSGFDGGRSGGGGATGSF
jgi:hypothetical protein